LNAYDHGALVASSGTVRDGGIEHTEANLNGIAETQTKDAFERAESRFLVVANKFQTGFDQPLLHTMYVDKKLGGVNAVQTLSRLNRTHPAKDGTMVLDFANEAEAIREAFEHTILSEGTDPNLSTTWRPGSRTTTSCSSHSAISLPVANRNTSCTRKS
jgi:type I restriction enzyme, R subunit